MDKSIFLAHYMLFGSHIVQSGERLLIEDKLNDGELAFFQFLDEQTDILQLFIFSGALNLDGKTILIFNSANPEDREYPSNFYYVAELTSPTSVIMVEESYAKQIAPAAEEAVKLSPEENLALVQKLFGPLRALGPEETLFHTKNR